MALPINRSSGRLHNKRARDRDGCEGETIYKSVINFDPKNVRSLVGNGVKMGQTCGVPICSSRCRDTTHLLFVPIYDSSRSCLTPMVDAPDSEISILRDKTFSNLSIAINIIYSKKSIALDLNQRCSQEKIIFINESISRITKPILLTKILYNFTLKIKLNFSKNIVYFYQLKTKV